VAKRETKAAGESPKRGRGRPKGQPHTGGRVKKTFEERMDVATDTWALKVLGGDNIKQAGKTGKQFWGPASVEVQESVARSWWNRRRPTLSAQHVQSQVETIHREPAEPRELARSVLSILEHARIADEPPIAEPAPSWPEPPAQLLIGRDDIIELTANSDAGPSTSQALNGEGVGVTGSVPSSFSNGKNSSSLSGDEMSGGEVGSDTSASPPPDKPLVHGDKLHVESNGSHCWWDQNRKKYAVFDSNNTLHGWRTGRDVALAHAATLPRGDQALYQQHPFAEISAQQIADEPRRDNLGHLPRATLNVVRQRPR